MSYSAFTNLEIKQKFGIEQRFQPHLFARCALRPVSDLLRQTLAENVSFALLQGSEKARSEFIIAPVMVELRKQTQAQVSIFSGVDFEVDRARGLNGICDFLVSRSPYQAALEAPVVVAVEAKQDKFNQGTTQCIAEMIAARIYNEQLEHPVADIYGCVTTGDAWRFLVLRGNYADIDPELIPVGEIEKIVGILWACAVNQIPPDN
jgi:hypothetical protein